MAHEGIGCDRGFTDEIGSKSRTLEALSKIVKNNEKNCQALFYIFVLFCTNTLFFNPLESSCSKIYILGEISW